MSLDLGSEKLQTLDKDLEHIDRCISLNLLKRRNFKLATGKTPEDVLDYLTNERPLFSSQTLVHGDFCMPNIIIDENNFGLIDVGDCGPGDPYKDLSALEVSIARNFGKE
ncbi:MAG: Aminoglycoside phosphotransferase [Candidatus Woesebacteria bacterium GW2011_GWA1_41_13b]|uniref:Aminoglycoside phosphotransferase n=2 Tax=Candidatus Woeseibacteriota TaxID=1752722 RepID=A0A0G0X2Y0_9BACT|nr:MAG: Aminoglycoside phosphotransferase [Candidatus Woesebacteria bacterium GW2011_GWA1_41_13b]